MGESQASLALLYGIGTSTVSDIECNPAKLEQFASKLDSEEGTLNRKTFHAANTAEVENATYIWFTQRRGLGEPISGPMVCENHSSLTSNLEVQKNFKANSGWLKNF